MQGEQALKTLQRFRCPGCGASIESAVLLERQRTGGWFRERCVADYRCLECAALFRLQLDGAPDEDPCVEDVAIL